MAASIGLPRIGARADVEAVRGITVRQVGTAVLALFFAAHGFIPGVFSASDLRTAAGGTDSTAAGLAVEGVAWSLAALLMAGHGRAIWRAAMRLRWTGMLVVLAVNSALWSQEPAMTLRKGVLLVFTTMFGVYLAVAFDWVTQLRILQWALVGAAALSSVPAAAAPAYGIDHLSQYGARAGAWQGIFSQKNICARSMVYGVLCVFALMQARRSARWSQWLGLALCGLVLAMTRSVTAMALAGMLLGAGYSIPRLRRLNFAARSTVLVMSIAGFAAVGALVWSHVDALQAMLGRSLTLTGRMAVWEAVAGSIAKHAVLGYGYQAFWQGLKGESANVVLAAGWFVPAAHNGFLEIWLQVGAVGLGLFLLGLMRNWRLLWREIRGAGGCAGVDLRSTIWPCCVLLLTVFYNLDESSVLLYNDLMWIVYVAVTAGLELRREEVNAWPAQM